MSQQVINTGSTANDNTGDTLRGSWQKANDNFTELYSSLPINNSPTAFTPVVTDSGGGRTFVITVNSARHTSIGYVTTFNFDITIVSVSGSATGNLRVTLPDPVAYNAAATVYLDDATNQAKTSIMGIITGGTSYVELFHFETGNTTSLASQLQATSRLIVSGVYFAS